MLSGLLADADGPVRGESAVAVAQENGDVPLLVPLPVVGHGQVEVAVAVEVAHRHGVGLDDVRGDAAFGR